MEIPFKFDGKTYDAMKIDGAIPVMVSERFVDRPSTYGGMIRLDCQIVPGRYDGFHDYISIERYLPYEILELQKKRQIGEWEGFLNTFRPARRNAKKELSAGYLAEIEVLYRPFLVSMVKDMEAKRLAFIKTKNRALAVAKFNKRRRDTFNRALTVSRITPILKKRRWPIKVTRWP